MSGLAELGSTGFNTQNHHLFNRIYQQLQQQQQQQAI